MDIKIIENILELDKIMQENETILIFSTLQVVLHVRKYIRNMKNYH